MKDDPCFRCTLPDCDEAHAQCVVRQLQRRYHAKVRHGEREAVTAEELEANSRVYESWKLERLAQAAEGIRPLRKPGSKWIEGDFNQQAGA